MNRILKVFADPREQDRLAKRLHVLAGYDAFALIEASASQGKRLGGDYLVEDITDQYEIPVHRGAIDTTLPRVDEQGATRSHPAYPDTTGLARGPHHYLVQFIGPIKDEWLAGVLGAGGEPRELYSNFAYVVRADEEALGKIATLPYVRWVGHLPHKARLATPVIESIERGEPAPTLPRTQLLPDTYTIEFF